MPKTGVQLNKQWRQNRSIKLNQPDRNAHHVSQVPLPVPLPVPTPIPAFHNAPDSTPNVADLDYQYDVQSDPLMPNMSKRSDQLHDHTDLTVDDSVYAILKYTRVHKLTDGALNKLLGLIRLLLPAKNKLPKTVSALRNSVHDVVPEGLCPTFLPYCTNCPNNSCVCGSPVSYFVKVDVKPQLQRIISKYKTMVHEYPAKILASDDFIDIQSGSFYREKIATVPAGQIPLGFNEFIDGASYTNSTNVQTWPICLSLTNLEPHTRHSAQNVMIAGYWHGTKPDWQFIYRHIAGFYETPFEFDHDTYFPFCAVATHDMPGRASHLNVMGVNAKDSCIFCKTQGLCLHHHMTYGPPGEPRTHAEFVENSRKADELNIVNGVPRKNPVAVGGSKGTALSHDHLCIPDNIAVDGMHTMDTGPCKDDLTKLMEGVRLPNFKLSRCTPEEIAVFNKHISMIQWPYEIDRKVRDLSTYKNFKATEFKCIVLYIAPTLIATVIAGTRKRQAQSLMLYGAFVALHSQSSMTQSDLDHSERLISRWFLRRPEDWGPYSCTNKAHEVCHIPSRIPINGPIRCYSGYWGESILMMLGGYITQKSPEVAAKQILSRFDDDFRLRVMENSSFINEKVFELVEAKSAKVKSTGMAGNLDCSSPYAAMLAPMYPFDTRFITQSRIFIKKLRFDSYKEQGMHNSLLYFSDETGPDNLGLLDDIVTHLTGPVLLVQKLYYKPLKAAFPKDFCADEMILQDPKTLPLYGYMPANPKKLAHTIIRPSQVVTKAFLIPYDKVFFTVPMSSVFEHN